MDWSSALAVRISIVFVVWFTAVGCNDGVPSEQMQPVALLESIDSQQPPEELGEWLKAQDLDWSVLEVSDLPNGDKRPRFSILRWQVDGFSNDGAVGQVQFSFYNDKLMAVWFFPGSSKDMAMIAKRAGVKEGESVSRDGVRIRVDRDFRGKPYVSYEDIELVRAMEEWLSKYS